MRPTKNARRDTNAATPHRAQLGVLRHLPSVLREFGVAVEPLLRPIGLRVEDLEDPARDATLQDLDALLGACARRTQCAHFGLLLGRTVDLRSLGLVGRLAASAPTVGEALNSLTKFFALQDTGAVLGVAITNETATFSYGIQTLGLRNTDLIHDLALAAMRNVLRGLCGEDWRPELVMLPRRRANPVQPYREMLQGPIKFDAMQAAMCFPARLLREPPPGADPLLHAVLRDRILYELHAAQPALVNEVRRTIRRALPSRRVSRQWVASELALHPRTLVRRLATAGTSFQLLLDETRAHAARQLLHDTRAPVSRVAAAVGYRDPAIFTRAFRRWTGLAPREFRATLRQDA